MAAPRHDLDESLLSALAERRLALRVPLEIRVSLWDRLRLRSGQMLDLSLSGARVRFAEPVTADRRPWLWIPAGLGGRFPHPIAAEVAWTDALAGAPTGHCQVGLRFTRFPWSGQARVRRVLYEMIASAARATEVPPPPERRGGERVAYDRRVIARGAGTPLVLLGRDLSAGGMCVETSRALAIGDPLQLALHAGGETPLVVQAVVVRSVGEGAWALAFRALGPTQRDRLDEILREQAGPQASSRSLLVSEVGSAS
ncbi:MAG TPA: PilZ domain-containing protein [Myxococcota bacterium]|nr:PilZ domain-containing protein [Myxococcota bacterium]